MDEPKSILDILNEASETISEKFNCLYNKTQNGHSSFFFKKPIDNMSK